jgi:DNA-directed RNA polymerase subunit RPC12/RpoP
MEKPLSGPLRALRQAKLYGHLVARGNRLYHPGGNEPVCSLQMAQGMLRSGWLIFQDGKYKITTEGQQANDYEERQSQRHRRCPNCGVLIRLKKTLRLSGSSRTFRLYECRRCGAHTWDETAATRVESG